MHSVLLQPLFQHNSVKVLYKSRGFLSVFVFFFGCLSSPSVLDMSEGTAERTAPPELRCLLGVCHVHWRVHVAALANHRCDPCLATLLQKYP